MRITLKRVADELGLSVSTVSHVLNGKGGSYNEATRKRISDAAEKLGYVPNASARAMRTGKFGTIALIMSNDPNRSMLFQAMATGICERLEEKGYHLILSILSDEQLTDPNFLPNIMRTWMVDGILVAYFNNIPKRFEELLKDNNIPSIWLNRQGRYDAVNSDDGPAVEKLVEHLYSLGHRNIAFSEFTGATRVKGSSMGVRYDTFVRKAESMNIKHTRWGTDEYTPRKDRIGLCQKFLTKRNRPSAVIALSPSNANPVLDAARLLDINIPDELSLITFADDRTDLSGIEIASLMIPLREIGECAVDLLLKKIKTPVKRVGSKKIELDYHKGETVSKAPKRRK
ncbi:LacI family DNA-binding transcriptional regulator [Rubellicoccus peritrichatus]|uniref:LacI family DNA-binding transcriptional regulator n=1 Tax=Rubellicoccus peritrichatus TaxID=3080537 RepID=A0AAQ3LA92_9BACT|nr:LacI family DNA-binding transcriptional regulator [Puniceicoccus sp. CR14]WOO41976.1 LacI family DNA-binding transcriptional regulator [Puniceicoccus sp. CR14]